jgi:hypothetical protein
MILPEHRHGESTASGRPETLDILTDLADAPGRNLDIAFGVAHLPTNGIKIVIVRRAKPLKSGDISFQPRFLHQSFVTGVDGLGHGKLVRLTFTKPQDEAGARFRPTLRAG